MCVCMYMCIYIFCYVTLCILCRVMLCYDIVLYLETLFQSNFRSTAILRGRYRHFPYIPCPPPIPTWKRILSTYTYVGRILKCITRFWVNGSLIIQFGVFGQMGKFCIVLIHGAQTYLVLLCIALLHFADMHFSFFLFYKLKERPSSSKKVTSH